MEFIQHTLNWTKGEIIEATTFGIAGLLVLIAGVLFWKFGGTINAKALVLPLIITGFLFAAIGTFGVYNNQQRLSKYKASYQENPTEFIKSEKARVEGFDDIFKYSFPAALIFTIGGALIFFFSNGANIRAISLAFIIIGLFVYFIDFFAEERAKNYYKEIVNELKLRES